MMSMVHRSRRRRVSAVAVAAVLTLSACQSGGGAGLNYNPPVGSPGIGTAGGAGAGALLGRAIAGGNNNTLAILGGALLGGVAGNVFVDNPRQRSQAVAGEAAQDREMQRRLDYERQSQIQGEETRKQIQEQQLFEQWKSERSGAPTAAASGVISGPADVSTAQRLLTGLGYYRGPLDGVVGRQTRSAVMQFEQAQGLPSTGMVTPALLTRMRQALAA